MHAQDIIRLLRVKQWVKNLLVFTGVFFAGRLTDLHLLLQAVLVFIAFSLAASIVYILNDLKDREADRQHPAKKNRPLANGRVTPRQASLIIIILLILLGVVFAFLPWKVHAIITTYILFNLAYTFWLKHIVLLDVYSLSLNYLFRILAGTTGLGIPPSAWLLLFFFFASLYFAFEKREHELDTRAAKRVLRVYTRAYLQGMRLVMLGLLIMTYAIYVMFKHKAGFWFLTSIPLLLAIFAWHELHEDKLSFFEEAVMDPVLVSLIILWLLSVSLGLYAGWQPLHLA